MLRINNHSSVQGAVGPRNQVLKRRAFIGAAFFCVGVEQPVRGSKPSTGGAGNTLIGQPTDGIDPDALRSRFKDDLFIHMLPHLDFEAQKEFRKGTQASEVTDYFAAKGRVY